MATAATLGAPTTLAALEEAVRDAAVNLYAHDPRSREEGILDLTIDQHVAALDTVDALIISIERPELLERVTVPPTTAHTPRPVDYIRAALRQHLGGIAYRAWADHRHTLTQRDAA